MAKPASIVHIAVRNALIGAVAVGFALVLAAPASAAAPAYCPAGYACLWGDSDYKTNGGTDRVVKFQWEIFNLGSFYYYPFFYADDNASSVYNNGNVSTARFYVNVNQAGPSFTLAKGTGDWNLSDSTGEVPGGFNDKLDSTCFIPYCPGGV